MSPFSSIPRFSYQDGILAIDSPLSRMQLRWQPAPVAEERLYNEQEWRPFLPEFRLLQPAELKAPETIRGPTGPLSPELQDMAEKKRLAFAAFRADLPPALIPPVERFPSHQWPLLVLLRENPKTLDLAAATPILAWCLANNSYFRERHFRSSGLLAVMHSHQKQREILEWLGFPGTEALVRLLRKIPPEAASPSLLNGLRLALQPPDSLPPGFTHLKTINAGVLALIGSPLLYPLLSPLLLEEVSESGDENENPLAAPRLMEVLNLCKAAKCPPPAVPLRSIAQTEALLLQTEQAYEAHLQQQARQAEEARRRVTARRAGARQETARRRTQARQLTRQTGARTFPSPPVPGTDFIVPLTKPDDLEQESRAQVNCVRTYDKRVASGRLYIYRILEPERATLAITLRPDGSWRRSELKGYQNGPVRKDTEWVVDHWLAAHRLSV